MTSIQVRAAGPGDARAISELLFEFNGEALEPEDLERRMAEVGELETALLGLWQGRAAGILVLRVVPTLSGAADWAEITELYVHPAARRKGLGSLLVREAVERARARGCAEVHLLVDPENAGAIAFYDSAGFVRDSYDMMLAL